MDPIEAILDQHRAIIDRVGWAVTMVGPDSGDHGHRFAYTVGLTALGSPEFVIAGLPDQVMQNLLNDLAIRVGAHAERFASGQRVGDLIRGYNAIIVEADGTAASDLMPASVAYGLYGVDTVVLQQVVWPDAAGHYPWDSGYRYAATVQPVIGRPGRAHRRSAEKYSAIVAGQPDALGRPIHAAATAVGARVQACPIAAAARLPPRAPHQTSSAGFSRYCRSARH
jgi:hypothetical protein